jgi:ornithine decarboxylase
MKSHDSAYTSPSREDLSPKLTHFLSQTLPTPFLVVDLEIVAQKYQTLRQVLPSAQIYYAVKANPSSDILKLLLELGANFDCASLPEIRQCLAIGAHPKQLSYSNVAKKAEDIRAAYRLGVNLFTFDSLAELEKLAACAPGSRVSCRILWQNQGAAWPLSRKFGCDLEMAHDLLVLSRSLGLQPYAVAFHVGSQQTNPQEWLPPIAAMGKLFIDLQAKGIQLSMLNIGGGFPAHYRTAVPQEQDYAQVIQRAFQQAFGSSVPTLMLEPGRSLVADAGVIQTEVVLIANKSYRESVRWLFLDVGKFGGLMETLDESIQYRILTPYPGRPVGPVVLVGPTCDSADILYEKSNYRLPLDLKIGDRLDILSTGAYTSMYASVGFNGFPPLQSFCI